MYFDNKIDSSENSIWDIKSNTIKKLNYIVFKDPKKEELKLPWFQEYKTSEKERLKKEYDRLENQSVIVRSSWEYNWIKKWIISMTTWRYDFYVFITKEWQKKPFFWWEYKYLTIAEKHKANSIACAYFSK